MTELEFLKGMYYVNCANGNNPGQLDVKQHIRLFNEGKEIYTKAMNGDLSTSIPFGKSLDHTVWNEEKPNEPGLYLWVEKSRDKSAAQTCRIFGESREGLLVSWSGLGDKDYLKDCANRLWMRIPE